MILNQLWQNVIVKLGWIAQILPLHLDVFELDHHFFHDYLLCSLLSLLDACKSLGGTLNHVTTFLFYDGLLVLSELHDAEAKHVLCHHDNAVGFFYDLQQFDHVSIHMILLIV